MTTAATRGLGVATRGLGVATRRAAGGHAQVTRVRVGGGVALAVSDRGPTTAAITVVFLHGFCLNRGVWTRQVDYLLRRYPKSVRVISYDQRGHGQSGSAPMSTYTIGQCAAAEAAGPLGMH